MGVSWRQAQLRDLVEIFDGPHATPKKVSSGPIFLGVSNLSRGRLDLAETEHLSEDDFVRWTRRVTPRAGDVVFSYETRLGEAALVPRDLKCCLGRRMGLLRARDRAIDPRYLLYAYLGPEFQETIRRRTIRGSTVDRIPLIEMPGFPITIPDIETQEKIAHILGTLDDKIELNRRMNETLEAMARALFKSWFVDFDPVHAKARGEQPAGMDPETAKLFPSAFEDSELGPIPKGWKVGSIADLGDVVTGKTPPKAHSEYFGTGYPFIKIPDMKEKIWLSKTQEELSEAGNEYQFKKLIPPNSIAVSCIATVGLVALVRYPSHTNQQINTLVTASEIAPFWAFLALQGLRDTIEARSLGGSVTKNLNKRQFESIKLQVPPGLVQQAFARSVDAYFTRIAANMDEAATLITLRDALLPRLLAGERSVTYAQKAATV
jgi:type I restriction enzyme S subunit